MDILVIALAALFASGLTLFSGFGLGTLLMPVVAIFFPIDIAVGITAVVHLANNVFKLGLLGRGAHWPVVARFGIPAVIAAFIGAWLLGSLSGAAPLADYSLAGIDATITPVKLVIGVLILVFALLELSPRFAAMTFDMRWMPLAMPLGGVLSGFFGGLSGHQGAFRSMFLIKSGVSKEQFIATSVVLAVMVDVARLLIYGADAVEARSEIDWVLVGVACVAAFVGAFLGARLIGKMTLLTVQRLVAGMLVVVGAGLSSGML
jgi:hypothetical protein